MPKSSLAHLPITEVAMSKRTGISRRKLLAAGGATTIGANIASTSRSADIPNAIAADPLPGTFLSQWDGKPDRPWLGSDFWSNPLHDWRVRNGAAECFRAAPNRQVHLL